MKVRRVTPIENLDVSLHSIDRDKLIDFARYWQRLLEGVKSTRTVRNWLHAARAFFVWCGANHGFEYPADVAKLFTAADVETPAEKFEAERLKKILAQGRTRGIDRLKNYVLLGLLLGYTQMDCCEIANADYLFQNGEHYIHRYRSKESRPKRGSRPIRVKHWIPPELAKLIEQERGVNPQGYLFNSERGNVLVDKLVCNIWNDATDAAGDGLSFKQLRKMAFNKIKEHASSREVADLWAGHADGISGSYDDGIFEPVIEAQRKFAEELRGAGIL